MTPEQARREVAELRREMTLAQAPEKEKGPSVEWGIVRLIIGLIMRGIGIYGVSLWPPILMHGDGVHP